LKAGPLAIAIAIALAIAIGCSACGAGVVPGTTYDQPLISFNGTISPTGGLRQATHPLVGLLWTDPLQHQADVTMPPRWMQSLVDAAVDTFTVDIFRPPPPEALVDLTGPSGEVSRMAFAEIVIIDDQDGDGGFQVHGSRATVSPPERYLAGSADVLTYVAVPFPSRQLQSPLTLPGQAGYAVVNYRCEGQLSAGTYVSGAPRVEMVLQPSQELPVVRPCRASHGP
jgi:hypothetical protein